MSLLSIFILACVQGLAELLPISSSAHVILTEKLLGMDPTSPEMTLLLVMLHTGTMFAVIVYFFGAGGEAPASAIQLLSNPSPAGLAATALTSLVGADSNRPMTRNFRRSFSIQVLVRPARGRQAPLKKCRMFHTLLRCHRYRRFRNRPQR